jgi:hypothetical protein
MKRILTLLLITAALTSCKNPADTQKAVAIGELGLQLLVAKNVIKPEAAALARQTGQILITPAAETSGK